MNAKMDQILADASTMREESVTRLAELESMIAEAEANKMRQELKKAREAARTRMAEVEQKAKEMQDRVQGELAAVRERAAANMEARAKALADKVDTP